MHKLDRGAAPTCLAKYRPGLHKWDHLTPGDKAQIRATLIAVGGNRCAYCESEIKDPAGHIEHFFKRTRYREKTFSWDNLFFSCDSKNTCGIRKDRSTTDAYDPKDLIKPDVDEPDDYLHFLSNGKVIPRKALSPQQLERAIETIRVFNLADTKLEGKRYRVLKQFTDANSNLFKDLEPFPEQDRLDFIALEIEATAGWPHCSVVRHFLSLQTIATGTD